GRPRGRPSCFRSPFVSQASEESAAEESALRIAVQAAVRRLTPVLARLSLVAECHRLVTLVPVGLIEPSEEAALFTRIRHAPLVLRVRARNGPRSGLYGGCGGCGGAPDLGLRLDVRDRDLRAGRFVGSFLNGTAARIALAEGQFALRDLGGRRLLNG